jgi:heme o synthase
MRPSPWLRLVALGAAAATLLAVVSGSASLGTAHRVLAALALPPLAAVAAAAWVSHRRLLGPSLVALVLFGLAAAVVTPGLHLALAAMAFAATLVVAALSWSGTPQPLQHGVAKSRGETLRDYATLTKPRIMSLLLLTGFCGMVIGAGGLPAAETVAATMVGLALACGGASALNHVLDADIDRLMGKRTRSRPVAAGRLPAAYALEFGLALSALSFVLLAGVVNVLAATLALVGNLFYVLVYTRLLKRSTPQNIVIGGAAGAIPPLVGWAAATGSLTLPALVLFLVVFLWTPPHFWALALLIKRDYAAAGVPMLPVVRGEDETARQIVLYTAALVAFTIAPALWGQFGVVYLVAAAGLGSAFLWLAWRLRRERTPARAGLLFHYSLAYLALIFVAMAIDAVVA